MQRLTPTRQAVDRIIVCVVEACCDTGMPNPGSNTCQYCPCYPSTGKQRTARRLCFTGYGSVSLPRASRCDNMEFMLKAPPTKVPRPVHAGSGA